MPKPHLPYPPRQRIFLPFLFLAALISFGAAIALFGRDSETVDCYAQKLEDRKAYCTLNHKIQIWLDGSRLLSLPKGVVVSIDLPEDFLNH
jgi:hypothetical protein